MARYDINTTTMGALLDAPEVAAIMEKHAPGVTSNPMIGMVRGMSAAQAIGMAGAMIGADKIEAIKADIDALA